MKNEQDKIEGGVLYYKRQWGRRKGEWGEITGGKENTFDKVKHIRRNTIRVIVYWILDSVKGD